MNNIYENFLKDAKGFFNYVPPANSNESFEKDLIESVIFLRCMERNEPYDSFSRDLNCSNRDEIFQYLKETFLGLGWVPTFKNTFTVNLMSDMGFLTLSTDSSYVFKVWLHFRIGNQKTTAQAFEIFKKAKGMALPLPAPPKTGTVKFLVNIPNKGLQASKVNNIGYDYQPLNYNAESAELIKNKVFPVLTNKDPNGRLVLLSGEPGTGKTALIRSLTKIAPTGNFIMVPANLLPLLQGPNGFLFLLEQRDGNPVIFIVEDADEALLSRDLIEGSNPHIEALSAVLNMTDGIVGAAIDLRIILTTNLKTEAIDKAITRPGRLAAHVELGALEAQRANLAFQALTGSTKEPFEKSTVLANVYQEALKG